MIHRRLLQLAGAVPAAILALALVGIAISALHLVFAVTAASVIVALVHGSGDLAPALALLTAVTMMRGVAIWVREPLAARVGASVRIRLRRRLLDRLSAVPVAERDSREVAATVIDAVEGLDAYYTRYLPQLLVVFVVPAAVVAITWNYSATAGLTLAVAAVIAVVAPRAWDARLLRNGRNRWHRFARLSSEYIEALQSIPLLRSFGAGGRTAARLASDAEALRLSTMAQLRLSLVETVVSALAMHLGTVLAVAAALTVVIGGNAEAAATITVLLLARECFRPVQDLGANWHAGYLGLTAVDGLDRLHSLRPAIADTGTHSTPASNGTVDVEDVAFHYPGTDNGLRGISLRIAAGETVAIIGPSGSGKSTLARLFERETDPDVGIIRIDGIELGAYTREARSRSVVVVPQDPVLFAWSARDNLRLYRPDASDIDIERVARTARIHDVISALPTGYNTVLAENGEQLSGGQRQRLAIARALLSTAPILVFDEVTSALDSETERHVMDAIATTCPSRTVILIAHRESACVHATRWIALEGGRIVYTGDESPTALALTNGETL